MAMAPQEMDEVTGICDGLNLNIGTPSEAVSYTHLDVYKRQDTDLLKLVRVVVVYNDSLLIDLDFTVIHFTDSRCV